MIRTWKTIRLGTHQSGTDLLSTLKDNKFTLSDQAEKTLPNIPTASRPTTVRLAQIDVSEYLLSGMTLGQIYSGMRGQELDLCPCEVGPQLRRVYHDQPESEQLIIAMEPRLPLEPDGYPFIFCIENHHGKWLRTLEGTRTKIWNPQRKPELYKFIFLIR